MEHIFRIIVFLCLFIVCEFLEHSSIFMREKKNAMNSDHLEHQDNRNDDMPKFHPIPCKHIGFKCMQASFPNGNASILVTKPIPATSILEGYVLGDKYIKTLIIDTPKTKKRLILLRSENYPHCYCFDIDLFRVL